MTPKKLILLAVDDDPALLESLRAAVAQLAPDRITLLAAPGSRKAIELADRVPRVHLLLADVYLAGQDGPSLRDTLLATHPELQTAFTTAYDISGLAERIGSAPVFPKPLDPAQVIKTILSWLPPEPSAEQPAPAQPAPSPQPAPAAPPSTPATASPAPAPVNVPAQPTPAPSAAPAPVPVPRPVPSATPSAPRPVAPAAVPTTVPATAAAAPAQNSPPRENLQGRTLGDYQLAHKLGAGRLADIYLATQLSMQRPVALKVLPKDAAADPQTVQDFIADASAKAQVQHRNILSVYEAGQDAGYVFCAREYADGRSLRDIAASGPPLDENLALRLIRAVAEALSWFAHNKTSHEPLTADTIYLLKDGSIRLANLATAAATGPLPVQDQIRALAAITAAARKGAPSSPPFAALISRMQSSGPAAFPSWSALIQAVRDIEPKAVPLDASKISEQEEAAKLTAQEALQAQKRSLKLTIIGLAALLVTSSLLVYFFFFHTHEKDFFDKVVRIPAGPFIYQDGQQAVTKEFWIDQYEVTIGQYARFLAHLRAHPEDARKFAAPDQPPSKTSHEPRLLPDMWKTMYSRARRQGTYRNVAIDLNCPIFGIDWYDAYAYAKWRGGRLPTEQEWEKAARGPEGNRYPWGNEADKNILARVNTSADFIPEPGVRQKGDFDGYVHWAPVDATPGDRSHYDVFNMAGNVSEWTASFDGSGGSRLPVIRGGSYNSDDFELTRRIVVLPPEIGDFRVGFRVVYDSKPSPPAK